VKSSAGDFEISGPRLMRICASVLSDSGPNSSIILARNVAMPSAAIGEAMTSLDLGLPFACQSISIRMVLFSALD
jgi:hypothetical protein